MIIEDGDRLSWPVRCRGLSVFVVEWVREASWNRHWSVVERGPLGAHELCRRATYTEARAMIHSIPE